MEHGIGWYFLAFFTALGVLTSLMRVWFMIKPTSSSKEKKIFWACFHTSAIILLMIGWYQEYLYAKSIQVRIAHDGLRVSELMPNKSPYPELSNGVVFAIQTDREITNARLRLEFNETADKAQALYGFGDGHPVLGFSYTMSSDNKTMTILFNRLSFTPLQHITVVVWSRVEVFPTKIDLISD
jgi:hypothetical protein